MRNVILILFGMLIFSACIKENKSGLVSQWEYLESDSGSGVLGPPEEAGHRVIDFFGDGTISCTGNLCLMGTSSNEITTGTYSETAGKIYLDTCNDPEFSITYSVDGNHLYLTYPGFNAWRQKYGLIK